MNTEPGVCALAGGAYITIWKPGSDPVTIDGNVAIPGHGLAAEQRGKGAESVTMEYGGGVTTLVGVGSVGVPGSLAAVDTAWRRFGNADWRNIFEPTIRAARHGFPLSSACHYYLGYSGTAIFGRSMDGFAALHDDGKLRAAGSTIRVPHLADSLALIAEEGASAFYEGDLAQAMVAHVQDSGGMLTAADLHRYEAILRPSLRTEIGPWSIATNPPPAVGGAVLSAMLSAFANESFDAWDAAATGRLIAVQRACLNYRKQNLDLADDVGEAVAAFLKSARDGQLPGRWTSASTVHTSAVDDQGLGCAITASSGYGSGEMPVGTGLWLNNCLGEIELNRRGLDAGPVGARLPSNMAPSVACREGQVLALGSPGADRITTALHQFLVNTLQLAMPLRDAVAHPRVHVDTSGDEDRLAAEPGLDLPPVDLPLRIYPEISMYFGGVGAASFHTDAGFDAAADPRREGGICIFHG
jgi:gamma-glutamyltranspeptidase/glutathione hydrolase